MCTPIEWADPVHALSEYLGGARGKIRRHADVLDGVELATFPVNVGKLGGLGFDGENLWVSDILSGGVDHGIVRGPAEDVVVKLAPDGTVLGTFLVGPDPSALAFDGENIRVCVGYDTLVELSLDGAKLVAQHPSNEG